MILTLTTPGLPANTRVYVLKEFLVKIGMCIVVMSILQVGLQTLKNSTDRVRVRKKVHLPEAEGSVAVDGTRHPLRAKRCPGCPHALSQLTLLQPSRRAVLSSLRCPGEETGQRSF